MSNDADNDGPSGTERRQRPDVRAIFDHAAALLAPFYRAGSDVAMEYWAARTLREAYPDLDTQGFQLLMAAASRACREHAAMHARAAATANAGSPPRFVS